MKLPGIVHKNLEGIHKAVMDILKVVNGGVSLGDGPIFFNLPFDTPTPVDNLAAVQVAHSFAVAGADSVITHNLGRVPAGYIVVANATVGGVVYNGSSPGTQWNTSTLTLRATVVGGYRLLIF